MYQSTIYTDSFIVFRKGQLTLKHPLPNILWIILILTVTACGLSEEEKQKRTATAVQVATNNAHATQTATLWTDTPTATATNTPTATDTATNTLTPSDTPTLTDTLTSTSTPTLTKTPLPTATATYTPIAYTIIGNRAVNARKCVQVSTCGVVDTIGGGDTIFVISKIEGDTVNGSSEWLELDIEGTQVFVHSSLASIAPTATPTRDLNNIQIKTYYVNSNSAVNVRDCASTDCAIAGTFNHGDKLDVIDDSGDWYEIELQNGSSAFIAEFLTSKTKPSALPTSAPIRATAIPQQIQPTSIPQQAQPTAIPIQPTAVPIQPTQPPAPVSTAVPQPQFTCIGDIYNCGDFSSCNQVMPYFNACPGDPSGLDRDNDGVPCESLCG